MYALVYIYIYVSLYTNNAFCTELAIVYTKKGGFKIGFYVYPPIRIWDLMLLKATSSPYTDLYVCLFVFFFFSFFIQLAEDYIFPVAFFRPEEELVCCMFIDLITKTYISRLAHKSRSGVNHGTESFRRLFLQAATGDVLTFMLMLMLMLYSVVDWGAASHIPYAQ